MKVFLQSQLAKYPRIYKQLLLWRGSGNYNLDKIVFLSLLQADDIVFDIGANNGYYTLTFSQIVGKSGRVYAFEPVEQTFIQFSNFIKSNQNFDNIIKVQEALGETVHQTNIYLPIGCNGQASLTKHFTASWTALDEPIVSTIAVNTVDTYIESEKIDRLNFIKIDIEGYELMCLRGANKGLAKHKPLLYLEIFNSWSKDFGYSSPDIVSFLQNVGYDRFYLVHNGIKLLNDPITQLAPSVFEEPANLICAIENEHTERLARLSFLGERPI